MSRIHVAIVASALLLIAALPAPLTAAVLLIAALAWLTTQIWADLRPLWNADAPRVEDTPPTTETEL
jgi:hypothetical protein